MDFFKAFQVFAAGLIFVLAAVFLSDWLSSDTSGNQPRDIVSCPPEFLAYQVLSQKESQVLHLISDKKVMYAKNGEFVDSQIVITKSETEKSKVACGYLHVVSGSDQGGLQSWEHLYINPNGFGGHISSENQIGLGDGDAVSDYVFPLNGIKYWKDLTAYAQGNVSSADWAALLNVSPQVTFMIGMSSENPTSYIQELSIAYKCWNPDTGEENDGCKLNIQSRDSL